MYKQSPKEGIREAPHLVIGAQRKECGKSPYKAATGLLRFQVTPGLTSKVAHADMLRILVISDFKIPISVSSISRTVSIS